MTHPKPHASTVTILTAPKRWRKELAVRPDCTPDLTPEETANVRRALRFLRVRVGTAAKLGAAIGVPHKQIDKLCSRKGRPGVGMALRVARAAHVNVEDVLGGAWPPEGACPHCGRV